MGTLLNVTHDEQRIEFKNEEINFYGYTTYTEEVWEQIKDLNWRVNDEEFKNGDKTYIYTGSNRFGKNKKLHQIVMLIWYGEKEFKEAYDNGFKSEQIVEHHDNDAFNCLIENLSFASKGVNLAKSQTYDKERLKLANKVAVHFFKDFKTRKYQITLGFNEPSLYVDKDSKLTSLGAMYLLYEDDFRLVLTDATRIVWDLLDKGRFQLKVLSYTKKKIEPAIPVYTNCGEKIPALAFKDGKGIAVFGDTEGSIRLDKISPKKELYEKK